MTTWSETDTTSRANLKNARILIVEDNRDQSLIIASALKQCLPEVKPVFLTTESEVMTYLHECGYQEWQLPKLVLLDLYVPDRDNGWRILDKIRTIPAAEGKIPVVLLSSSANQKDINEAYDRGCSSYLVKPGSYDDWISYFKMLRTYWWETVALPKAKTTLF